MMLKAATAARIARDFIVTGEVDRITSERSQKDARRKFTTKNLGREVMSKTEALGEILYCCLPRLREFEISRRREGW